MKPEAAWWKESDERFFPQSRRLGIFRRQIRLKEHSGGHLTIPSLKLSASHRLLFDGHFFTTANRLTVIFPLTQPANLIGISSILSKSESGSVSLVGALLNKELPAFSGSTERSGLHQKSSDEVPSSSSEVQIPLWKRLAYLLQPPANLLLSEHGPLEWRGALFEYQMEGIEALLSQEALLLADDMGLGKTIQAIGALRILVVQQRVESALLIVPASLVSQWRRDLYNWSPELRVSTIRGPSNERAWQWATPAHVYLTSYETFRSDCTDNPVSPPRRRAWDLVILDEAQKIKNRDVEVSRKCKHLHRCRAWALTGTPLENNVDELASILEFVTPFKDGDKPQRLVPGPKLREKHEALQLRRKKSDVLPHLPAKIVSQITLPLDGAQRESYDRAERKGIVELQESGDTVRIENVLELIMKLKQICNFCPTTGQSAKLDDIYDRLSTLQSEGHRALIFSQFTDQKYGVSAIVSKLQSLQPLSYTGDLSSPQKDAIIKEFKENPARKVLVLSLRAGGQGLNLQDASYVFHFDRWWNPAVERQAEDRAHRLGQVFPVHIYKYILEGTIEERIDKILREKQLLFNEFVDDVSLDLKSKLTSEDLFGLFGLKPPKHIKSFVQEAVPPVNYAEMTGIDFEQHVKQLLESKGWVVETTPLTRDGGIDLIARRSDDVGAEVTLYIQCKNYSSAIGVDKARNLNGVLPKQLPGIRGVLVCPAGFTADAIVFAKDRGIALWDRSHLFKLSG